QGIPASASSWEGNLGTSDPQAAPQDFHCVTNRFSHIHLFRSSKHRVPVKVWMQAEQRPDVVQPTETGELVMDGMQAQVKNFVCRREHMAGWPILAAVEHRLLQKAFRSHANAKSHEDMEVQFYKGQFRVIERE